MSRLEALIAAAAAAALVAGCGGGSGSTPTETHSAANSGGGAAARSTVTGGQPPTSTAATSTAATSTRGREKPPHRHPRKPAKRAKPRPSSPATPAATVDAALTSSRCDLYTARLLQKSYGGLAGCEAALKAGGLAQSVDVQRTQPEGRFALVVAIPRGGPSSGEKLAVSLVKESGAWRLEAIHSNVKVGP